jgi:hypothetical protein
LFRLGTFTETPAPEAAAGKPEARPRKIMQQSFFSNHNFSNRNFSNHKNDNADRAAQ